MSGTSRFTTEETSHLIARAARRAVTLDAGSLRRLQTRDYLRAVRTVDDVCQIVHTGRQEELELSFAEALKRLENCGGDLALAIRRLRWAVETYPGMPEAISLAEEVGVSLKPSRSIYSLIRERGRPGAMRHIEHLASVMDHAALLGIACPQSTATWKLGRAVGDIARVLDDLTDGHRKRIARLSSPCRVLVPPRGLADRTNAYARCGCLRCQDRLAVQMQPYIGKMVTAPLCAGLDRDEARAQANDELLVAIETWPGRNFSGWFSSRFRLRVRSMRAAQREKERMEISLDAPAVLADDGDGSQVPLGERIPDRTIDVAKIAELRERVAEAEIARRRMRRQRAEEVDSPPNTSSADDDEPLAA
jgi:hypothetical protein